MPAQFDLARLKVHIAHEHPDWTPDQVQEHACKVRRELQRLHKAWQRSEHRYRQWTELFGVDPQAELDES